MKTRFLLIIGLLFLAANVSAQSDSVLTFKDAVRIALKNNATLNAQRNTLVQSRVNKTYRMAQLGPTAGIGGSVSRSNGNQFIPQEGTVVNSTFYRASATLQVNQPIFNGLTGLNTARSASAAMDAQMEAVNRSTQDVINIVATQYLQVLLDLELLKIAEQNVVTQKAVLDQVKGQVEHGSRPPVDEYNQQALVSNAELRVTQAELALTNDKILLFQALMVDPTLNFAIEEPQWDVNAIALDNLDLDQLITVALERRSDLRQAKAIEKSSRLSMNASKGNFLPSLNGFFNYGSAWNQRADVDKTAAGYRTFNEQFLTDFRFNQIGIQFNVPLFNSFQNRFFYTQSKVLYQNSKLQLDAREVTVKSDVLRAFENFETVKKAYSAGQTGLEASTQALNLETERYNLGVTAFVDFANANRTYVQAQTDMAQAKYRFLFQKIMLDYAVGTLKIEDLP